MFFRLMSVVLRRRESARHRTNQRLSVQPTVRLFVEELEDRLTPATIYAINAGGAAVAGALNWTADTQSAPSTYSNAVPTGSQIFSTGQSINLTDPSVPSGTPEAVFQSERWDPAGGSQMQWSFPVTPGSYQVRLYFSENYGGTQAPGARVFDVSIENQLVLDNYDMYADVGGYKGVVKTFQVTSDTSLDVVFGHVVENPSLKAIEISTLASQANQLGVNVAGLNFGNSLVNTPVSLPVTLTNLGGAGDPSIVVDATTLSGTSAGQFGDSFNDAGNITLAPGAFTTINVTFTPTSAGSKTASLAITHSGSNNPVTVPLAGAGTTSATTPVGFGKTTLQGVTLNNPTSLQFGPDGRLYVAEQSGLIKAITVNRTAANVYTATATQTISLINTIPNHDDNGVVNPSVTTRQVTGLMVTGTAANPVVYVTSSDPRIGGGSDSTNTGLDTNSGTLSKLTYNGSTWSKIDLVHGLPRSAENHSPNGLALDPATNTLFIAQGGNTNAGAPSNNFVNLPEYALSAAILSVDLDAIGNTTYNLPTLNDDSRPGTADANDPFGGNLGKNQAIIVPGGPVQVYSSGFRNPYDVVWTESGKLYSIDNGANAGWGGVPLGPNGQPTTPATAGTATNAVSEPGQTDPDNLHLVTQGFYAGHPNPTRANKANTFNSNQQSPVPTANPVEGYHPQIGTEDGALTTFVASTNGLTEYTAGNFGNALKGSLLAASFDNVIYSIKLNAAGTAVTSNTALFSSVGATPLDVAVGAGTLAGTIWVADYSANSIVVFEPNDFGGSTGGGGTGADDPTLDEDGDGYNNRDEILNGTNPLSAADKPPDWDADFLSNLLDDNDDNDGLPDAADPFAIDASNGKGRPLPVNYLWDNATVYPGGLLNLGFTGLMIDGAVNYGQRYDPTKLTAGGAAGALTIDQVSEGTATGAANSQEYAFQFGVDVTPATGPFTAHTRILAPFAGLTPQAGQSMGLFVGNGDQDNYFKIVVAGDGGVQWQSEVAGAVTLGSLSPVSLPGPSAIDLYLSVNPYNATVQPRYTVTAGGVTGPVINVGSPIAIPSSWWTGPMGMAVGIISTSAGPGPVFPATWDLIQVIPDTAQTLLVSQSNLPFGSVPQGSTRTQSITLTNAGSTSITVDATSITGANAAQFSDSFNDAADIVLAAGASTTINVTFAPSGTGSRAASLVIAHTGANALTIPLTGQAQQASTGNALVEITPNQFIDVSTFFSNSFQITNNSTGGTKIQNVRFDLSTALLPDVVFDPAGGAGDGGFKPFTPDTSTTLVGLGSAAFSSPKDGGFFALDIPFSDFGPGERFDFSIDIDPTSIKGSQSPGPSESGSVSGLEMTGGTVTVTFDDGSVQTAFLFRQVNSVGGGRTIVTTGAPAAVGIQMLGAASPATLSTPVQTVRLTGPAGSTATLLQVEAGLFTAGSTNGGFDLDPFEANNVVAITEKTAVIGSGGFVDVPVTLTRTGPLTGLNYFVATIKNASGQNGPTSPVVVVNYNPNPVAANQPPAVNAGADVTISQSSAVALQGTVIDDGKPAGSTVSATWTKFSGPGTVTFNNASSATTTANFSLPGTYVLRLTGSDGQLSATDDVTVTVNGVTSNTPPTVATPASSVLNTAGTQTQLNVLGADNAGEANLTYTWSVVSKPATAANPTFSANGTNAAKSAVATFSQASATPYVLRVTATDQGGLSVFSDVSVTVNPVFTGIVVTPTSVNLTPGNTQAFTGSAKDQFGATLASQPALTWSLNAGSVGTISAAGLYTAPLSGTGSASVKATSGAVSGTATVSIAATTAPVFSVNAGGTAATGYGADAGFSGGSVYSTSAAINTTGITNPAPQSVYQSERYGNFTYTATGLTPGAAYTVQLQFAEIFFNSAGSRVFNTQINGTTVLSNYDIYAQAGANNKAVTQQFNATANSSGQIVIAFTSVVNNAKLSGIQIRPI